MHKVRRAKASGALPEGPIRIFVEHGQRRADLPWTVPAELTGTARNPVVVTAQDGVTFLPADGQKPTRLFRLEAGVSNVTFENFNFKSYGPNAVERANDR